MSLGGHPGVLYNGLMMGDPRDQGVDRQGPALREAHCVLWHAPNVPASSELRAALDRRGMVLHEHDQRATALAELCLLRGPRGADHEHLKRVLILVMVEPERLNRPDEMKDVVDRYAPKAAVWMYRASGNPQLRAVSDQDLQRWRAHRPAPQPRVAASIKSPAVWADAKPARRTPAPTGDAPSPAKPRPPATPMSPFAPVIVGPRLRLAGELRPGPTPSPGPQPETGPVPAPAAEQGPQVEPKVSPGGTTSAGGMDIRQLLSEEELAMLLAGGGKPSQV